MNKKFLIGVITTVSLMVPFGVFAATSETPAAKSIRSFCGIDFTNLTDQQKADLKDSQQKMLNLQKETIQKMIDNGTLTQEQGDAALKRLDEQAKNMEEEGFLGMPGMLGMPRMMVKDRVGKNGFFGSAEKIQEMIDNGTLTQEQGEEALKRLEERQKLMEEKGISGETGMQRGMMGKGGFRGKGIRGSENNSTDTTTPQTAVQ